MDYVKSWNALDCMFTNADQFLFILNMHYQNFFIIFTSKFLCYEYKG